MKKFLIALLAVLGVQAGWADGTKTVFRQAESLQADYFAGKLDLQTAQALCVKVFDFARVNNVELLFSYDNGAREFIPDSTWCNNSDLGYVVRLTSYLAVALNSLDQPISPTLLKIEVEYIDDIPADVQQNQSMNGIVNQYNDYVEEQNRLRQEYAKGRDQGIEDLRNQQNHAMNGIVSQYNDYVEEQNRLRQEYINTQKD